jgi:dTDP-4-dehydrorhamnose reductase
VRVLVTGAGGQLGSDLAALLCDVVALDRHGLDISNGGAVLAAVREARPDVVFNCAAYNAVDQAEREANTALAVNWLGVRNLADACAVSGARLVHFSTNFVFAGDAAEPYTETDEARPLSVYGDSKLKGEQAALAEPSALVVRSSGLFGVRGSAVKGGSFPERIVARARSGERIRVVSDQRLNPTFTRHLAQAVIGYVEAGLTGVVHAVADGCCGYSDLAREALRLAGLDVEVEEIASAELAAPAKRPLNGCLRSVRVDPLPDWRRGLGEWWTAFEK